MNANEEFEEITHEFWNPTKDGDTIIGNVGNAVKTQYGDTVVIDTDNGPITMPNLTALVNKLKPLTIGTRVKIVFVGTAKSATGRTYKDFKIFRGK